MLPVQYLVLFLKLLKVLQQRLFSQVQGRNFPVLNCDTLISDPLLLVNCLLGIRKLAKLAIFLLKTLPQLSDNFFALLYVRISSL